MVERLKSLLSLFGASGYRYKFSLFVFDNIHGVEDAFPDEGAVFLFARRFFNALRLCFDYKLLYCGATRDLSALSVGNLAGKNPSLRDANCIGVLYEADADVRARVLADVSKRNFK
jgi:hypothetical protein